jgi:hypothetical protein
MIEDEQRDAGRLPSEEQMLLLRAALLPGVEGQRAAFEWLESARIEHLDMASRRLMPLLYDRLRREAVDHPLMAMLNGVKKHTWYYNRLLFHRAGEAIRILGQSGIQVMVLKGMALTIAYYRDASLRPMGDVDLLVGYEHADAAIQALCRNGWRSPMLEAGQENFYQRTRRFDHAIHLLHPSGQDVDLHWNLLSFCSGPQANDDFWAASAEIMADTQAVRILNPADQLLHICVHGAAWDIIAPIRWIADAVIVLRATPELDWDRFLYQSRKRDLSLLAAGALDYIHRNFGHLVPNEVLRALKSSPVSAPEKFEYIWILKPVAGTAAIVCRNLSKFWRISQKMTLLETALTFPDFVCWVMNIDRRRQLPAAICRMALRRMRRFLGRQLA